jgi:hypothetical protein
MPSYQDRSKIKAAEYEIYLAKRTNTRTPVTLPLQSVITAGGDATWKPVGAYVAGGAKYKTKEFSAQLQGGQSQQFGVEGTFEVPAMETDETKLTALEGFINESVDVLCVEIGAFNYIRYNAMGLSVNVDDALTVKDGNKFPLKGMNQAPKVSDLRDQGVLAES